MFPPWNSEIPVEPPPLRPHLEPVNRLGGGKANESERSANATRVASIGHYFGAIDQSKRPPGSGRLKAKAARPCVRISIYQAFPFFSTPAADSRRLLLPGQSVAWLAGQ